MTGRHLFFFTILVIAIASGCSSGGVPTIPVNGTVTFSGGPPPTNGTITFTPITVKEGLPQRPGTANFDKDGKFSVTSFKENDGLIPGTYGANISCWKAQPNSNDPSSFERNNYVPKDFVPKPIVVSEDESVVTITIDVTAKK